APEPASAGTPMCPACQVLTRPTCPVLTRPGCPRRSSGHSTECSAGAPSGGRDAALTDAAVVGRILREYHQAGVEPSGIRRLTGSVRGDRVTYRLAGPGGPGGSGLVVRAFRTDVPLAGWLRGGETIAVTDWLSGRAATLGWLEERAYPAPRVIRTHSGDPVGLAGIWATLATSYVAGASLRPDTDQLRLLGEALGRLHALDPGTGAGGVGAGGAGAAVGRAPWHPETAIPAALGRLEAVESTIPADQ